MKLNS